MNTENTRRRSHPLIKAIKIEALVKKDANVNEKDAAVETLKPKAFLASGGDSRDMFILFR